MSRSDSGSIEAAAMTLLEDALELPSDEQKAFIEACDDCSEEVRNFALDLLNSDRSGLVALRTGGAGEAFAEEQDVEPPELPGYRIIRQLGRGGMGAVFLAERSTRDFEHQVAIKVIKPGVLIDTLVERFRRERQILAQLNHPNIAHLYDGGETPDGQPYIVMEYIQGRTLRSWMMEDNPDLDSKLALFIQASQAVEFAHQNLIIHRDLTPNNVLVTDSGQAKLIDFGIARPQVDEGDQAPISPLSGLSLTPGFAAPERKAGTGSNTLTDIYSLGRIFALMTAEAGEGELDAIAARASAEDTGQRYGSVSEMIDEIENYRRKLPVASFSETAGYRVRKFIGREKPLVAAAAGLLLAIVAGLIATTWAYRQAEESRVIAEQRFDGLRDLAHFQLFDLYDEMDHVVGNTQGRLALAERSQTYLVSLADSRSDDQELQLETAEGFLRLARIQGIPVHPNFGEPDLAVENLDRAEAILRPLAEAGLSRAETAIAVLESYRSLVDTHAEADPEAAIASFERAEAALERVPEGERDWAWMKARRIARIAALEHTDIQLDTPMMERYVALLEADIGDWPGEHQQGYEQAFDMAVVKNFNATLSYNLGTQEGLEEAVAFHLESDAMFAAILEDHINDPLTLYRRAWNAYYGYAAAANSGDMAMAGRLLGQANDSIQHLVTVEEEDNSLNTFEGTLFEAQAEFLSNMGQHDEAIAQMQVRMDVQDFKLEKYANDRSMRDAAYGRALFGSIYRRAGQREQACSNWKQAEAYMAQLAEKGALDGYIDQLRTGVVANLVRCDAGDRVTDFTALN